MNLYKVTFKSIHDSVFFIHGETRITAIVLASAEYLKTKKTQTFKTIEVEELVSDINKIIKQ